MYFSTGIVQLQNTRIGRDVSVSQMLRHLSESSPECLVHSDEEALSLSFSIPAQLSADMEEATKDSMIKQQLEEKKYARLHASDKW